MLKINHLRLQNRKIFFGLAFGAARLRSPGVQNRPLRARNRKIFFGLAPALRACARRPRPAATDGWREGPTPQSVRRNMRKRGTATPSHAAVLGSNLVRRLPEFHKQRIHCFHMEGTSGAPRKGASRDIHFGTIFENLRKQLKNRRFSWNSAFSPGTKFPLFPPARAAGRIASSWRAGPAHPHPSGAERRASASGR